MFKRLLRFALLAVFMFTTVIGVPISATSSASLSIGYLGEGADGPILADSSEIGADFALGNVVWVCAMIDVPSSGNTFLTDVIATEMAFNYNSNYLEPYDWGKSGSGSINENMSLWGGSENEARFNFVTNFGTDAIDVFGSLSEPNEIGANSRMASVAVITECARTFVAGSNRLFTVPFKVIGVLPKMKMNLVQLALTPQTFSMKNAAGEKGQWGADVNYDFVTTQNLKTAVFGGKTSSTTLAYPLDIVTPTITPSVTPTITPSVTPTITPSVTPTITPSVTPTITPSVTPTITPSAKPGVSINRDYLEPYFMGYEDDNGHLLFKPFNIITREEFAVVLGRTLNNVPDLSPGTGNKYAGSFEFIDEKSIQDWSLPTVRFLHENGVLIGEQALNGFKFNPTGPLKRSELAKIITLSGCEKMKERCDYWQQYQAKGVDASFSGVVVHDTDYNVVLKDGKALTLMFGDVPADHWAWPYIYTLAEFGVAVGNPLGFRPDDYVTRAEVSSVMFRMMRNREMTVVENAGFDFSKPEGPLNPSGFFVPIDVTDEFWYRIIYFGMNYRVCSCCSVRV